MVDYQARKRECLLSKQDPWAAMKLFGTNCGEFMRRTLTTTATRVHLTASLVVVAGGLLGGLQGMRTAPVISIVNAAILVAGASGAIVCPVSAMRSIGAVRSVRRLAACVYGALCIWAAAFVAMSVLMLYVAAVYGWAYACWF